MKIAVLDDYQNVARDFADWSQLGADCRLDVFHDSISDHQALADRLAPYEVICAMRERTPFARRLLERLPNLRLLVTTGMANAAIDVEAANDHGVIVCGTQSPGHATAELAFCLILALARRLVDENRAIMSDGWQAGIGRDLRGARLGIIGLGRLGSQVAGFGKAFGMDVVAWSQNLTPERCAQAGIGYRSRDDLLRSADFITIHLKLSERTRGLIGAAEIAAMKPDACLVNTSRAPIVDSAALVAALTDGQIGAAALDVFDSEPLAADDPIRSVPNLLLTPHIGYVTRETYRIFYTQTVEAIAAFKAGDPIRVITP